MIWILSICGVGLIVTGLRDVFHTLLHPGGFGTLSRAVFSTTWRAVRAVRPFPLQLAGPAGLLATLALWAALLVTGFALIYLPRMPAGFYFGSSLSPYHSSDVLASWYLSLVALTTLGLGDIEPATPLLRLTVPSEALLGFLLLTVGISWILQLYPALNRRRALARRLTTMARHDADGVVTAGDASIAVQHLEGVRTELAGLEMDLVQYAESYYFREASPELSLAATLPYVATLAAAGDQSSHPEVRQAAQMLRSGLAAFAAVLDSGMPGAHPDTDHTLAAFANDHRHSPLGRSPL